MRCGAAPSPTRWASRSSARSTSGPAPSGRPACTPSSTSASRAGSTTSPRSISARRRDDIFVLAARDAAERVQAEFGERQRPGLGSRPRGDVRASAGDGRRGRCRGSSIAAGADDRRRHDGDARQLEPPARRSAPGRSRPGGSCSTSGEWDESRVVLPTGQSGHPLSPHYFDQNEMWRSGQYRPQPFSREARAEGRRRTGWC